MYRTLQTLQAALAYQENADVALRTSEVINALDRTLTAEGFEEGEGDDLDTAVTELENALDAADTDSEEADDTVEDDTE